MLSVICGDTLMIVFSKCEETASVETTKSFHEYFVAENEAAEELRRKIDTTLKSHESGNGWRGVPGP